VAGRPAIRGPDAPRARLILSRMSIRRAKRGTAAGSPSMRAGPPASGARRFTGRRSYSLRSHAATSEPTLVRSAHSRGPRTRPKGASGSFSPCFCKRGFPQGGRRPTEETPRSKKWTGTVGFEPEEDGRSRFARPLRLPEFESHWPLRSSRPLLAEAGMVGSGSFAMCGIQMGVHNPHRSGRKSLRCSACSRSLRRS